MHPINRILTRFGLQLSRTPKETAAPSDLRVKYSSNLVELNRDPRGFHVFLDLRYEAEDHPHSYIDFECGFVARHLRAVRPKCVLDVGSYRQFISGLLAHYCVTTLDIRNRRPNDENETVLTGDVKNLTLSDDSFDAVVSMCAVEHFGLGRYGDEFDPEADKKGVAEMIRVLKPGGHLIFTTTITRGRPSIAFNAHRIYTHNLLAEFCADLVCVDEKFYSNRLQAGCSFNEVTQVLGEWDLYCGCWKKE